LGSASDGAGAAPQLAPRPAGGSQPAGDPACTGGAITINDNGPATPYPSTCVVSGLTGAVSDVLVIIGGLSHTYPDDVDLLLVAPNSDNAIIMSDVGGATGVVNCGMSLSDDAADVLPDSGAITCSHLYRPANYQPGDPFPAPAPAPSGNVNLSTFNGGPPNGTWKLYVVDDDLDRAVHRRPDHDS
jgi:hypothetical protein